MTIENFAKKYRLKPKKDECDEVVIPGKYGQIFVYNDRLFGVMYMPDPKSERDGVTKAWSSHRQKMAREGFVIYLDCDGEGIGLFDPNRPTQARLAIKVAGCKRKRVVSQAVIDNLRKARRVTKTVSGVPVGR